MQRRIHNKTLIVAALSVYLGLLIVGAPPQVWAETAAVRAHAATPKKITEEATNDSEEALRQFLETVRRLVAAGSFDLDEPFDVSLESEVAGGRLTNPQIALRAGDETVYNIVRDLADALNKSDYLFAVRSGSESKFLLNKLRLDFELNAREGIGRFTFDTDSPRSAQSFAAALNFMFAYSRKTVAGKPAEAVYQNARITFKDNQVFIVTRLPRGSLVEILKTGEGEG